VERREFRGRWKRLCDRVGVYLSDPDKEQKRLARLYKTPPRAYHNLDHVGFCLLEFDRINHLADRPGSVELAIWFHDAKYDPKSSRNEEESANELAAFCDRAGVLPEVKKRACEIVMASKHPALPADRDAQIFSDVDLAVLGQAPKAFWLYEEAIAREYRQVPRKVFQTKRAEILDRLLARESIYATRLFQDLYERKARRNLWASISRLRKGV
jgi:predicted metal-dependent HD superfamily phosphohydrolase